MEGRGDGRDMEEMKETGEDGGEEDDVGRMKRMLRRMLRRILRRMLEYQSVVCAGSARQRS